MQKRYNFGIFAHEEEIYILGGKSENFIDGSLKTLIFNDQYIHDYNQYFVNFQKLLKWLI